jgi:hypothetical protein
MELSHAPMIEFERPERVPVARTAAVARALPVAQPAAMAGPAGPQEAEVEVVEADLVEVIEEPAEEPVKERKAVSESAALAVPLAPPATEPVKMERPVPPEKMTVPAPIYHKPKLKIIATRKTPTRPEGLPLPPPPPDYKGSLPPAAVHGEPAMESPHAKPDVPPEMPVPPIAPEQAPPVTPEKTPPLKTDAPAMEKASPLTPQPAPAPTTGRRTGGLYDIFRRKPAEPNKEVPAPEKVKNEKKKKEDEELLKKLKTIEK